MTITKQIKMDLLQSGPVKVVDAVQGDNCSRCLEFSLFTAGTPFLIPENTSVIIRYKKMDKTGGEYDTLPNGARAWSIFENAVTITLAPQVLTFPGRVDLSVTLVRGGTHLTTFPVSLDVKPVARALTEESQDYFFVTSILSAPVSAQVGEYLRVCAVTEEGLVTGVEAVPIDSVAGEAGVSATHSWDGTVLTISSAAGTSSADLKGAQGNTGKSAYETALDGGYLGTEEEFAAKLAVDHIDWFGKGISIPSGADLNTYKTAGKYYAQSESTAQSLVNCPTTTNFVMFVFLRTSNVYSQLIIGLNGKMYIRSSSTSAWRAWVAYTTSEEIAELTEAARQEIADGLAIPQKTSELINDSGFLTAEDFPEAADSIDWFGTGVSVPSGSDLDSYTAPGKYYVESTSVSGSITNAPVTNDNYVLFVLKRTVGSANGSSITQMIITHNSALYLRGTNSAGVYKNWVRIAAGEKGADGYTPVKGVDYWTEEDQEAIVQQVITALGTPVFGTVDENKVITLTGDLADGTYTLKYEGSDGSKLSIGTVTIGETINQIPISTDENGAVFNAVGYQSGYRINSSGSVTENSYYTVTGFIPFTQTDILRISADAFAGADDGGYNSVAVFDPDKTFLGNVYADALSVESDTVYALDVSDRSTFADAAFVRITGNGITADTVATVNQPID